MKNYLNLILTMVFAMGFSLAAHSSDEMTIAGKNASESVVVTRLDNGNLQFKYCQTGTENCRRLGTKDSYSKQELDARAKHYRDIAYATGAGDGAIILVAAVFTGGVSALGSSVILQATLYSNWFYFIGASVGGATAWRKIVVKSSTLNPSANWTKNKDIQVAESENSQQVKDIATYANTLEAILTSIQ